MTTARPELDLQSVKIIQLGDDRSPLQGFSCGERQVDDWAARCHDYERSHRTRAFVAQHLPHAMAFGFYSLSLRGEAAQGLSDDYLRGHNNSGVVPFVYIDFIGVETTYQNRGLGTVLLIDALRRCHRVALAMGFCGVALHSLNDRTTRLYQKHGFAVAKPDLRNRHPLMVLPTQYMFDLFGPVYETNEGGVKATYVYPRVGPA